ncbi:hypothetical protein [Paenalcaligenes suwonensis]|uniref:hypothetical protein n=1 Tax=Paenalcaligenes suwonensis TaxID=1202713 RepID=UPI00140CA07A|nr:hypothetical protein [Paenalcaligenes suwonensis]NHC62206.1 hypothetical protein [Paenalcaligenes suwonensis]
MERKASGALVNIAILLVIATIIASVVLLAMYGKTIVINPGNPSFGISSRIDKVINWPLVIGLGFGVFYTVLLAVLAERISSTNDLIVDIHNKLKASQPD